MRTTAGLARPKPRLKSKAVGGVTLSENPVRENLPLLNKEGLSRQSNNGVPIDGTPLFLQMEPLLFQTPTLQFTVLGSLWRVKCPPCLNTLGKYGQTHQKQGHGAELMPNTYSKKVRRPYVDMSSFNVNQFHLRNPWIAVWWSLAFPGGGHMMLCKYFTGSMLMLWEFLINVKSNLNLAITLSMTGQFDKAKAVLDPRWFFLYMGVYLFALWDSYRLTIDMNKLFLVADREDASILPVKISTLESNYLDIRSPWNGVIWSLITPGLGQIYFNRLPSGFYLLISFVVAVYQAHVGNALLATMTGHFDIARSVLNSEWLLFMPSIYGLASYDAFVLIKELNKLFEIEQSRFLSDHYKSPKFRMPKAHA